MKTKFVVCSIFIFYIATIFWFTVLNRSVGMHTAQFELFWSYKKWLAGDLSLGKEIVANVVMFIPFGVLLSELLNQLKIGWNRKAVLVVCAALLFSMTIEILQLVLMRGLFEWDDIVSNTAGAFTGYIFYSSFVQRVHSKYIVWIVCSIVVIGCTVIIKNQINTGVESDITPRIFCFQVDEVEYNDDEVTIEGFTFRYEHDENDFVVILQSARTGRRLKLKTEKCNRLDVNNYFFCDYDYTKSGFIASGMIDAKEEYELMVKWPGTIAFSTGIYITGTKVHYVPKDEFVAPSGGQDLEKIVEKGSLRVYRPDYHCWVYQIGTALYWIVDENFAFEDDGSTYVQYQLWTTQEDRLPKQRIENGWMWDNIGDDFEKHELQGDFGFYRVSCRELPTEYSIVAIVTGYYKNGNWIWKNYFRPDYGFCF